jgi:hypothetical protein
MQQFLQPVFMVQPAENILDPDPADGWQLMPLNCLSLYWLPMEIWNARPQAGVWSSLIVIRRVRGEKPLEMALVQGDDVVEQIAPAAAYPAFRNTVLPGALDRGLHGRDCRTRPQSSTTNS